MRSIRVVTLGLACCWASLAGGAGALAAQESPDLSDVVTRLASEGRHAWTISDAEFAAKRSAIVRRFEVPIAESGALTLDLRSTQVDPLIRVLDADGTQLHLDDDSGIEWNAHLELQVEAGDTLHLEGISQAPHGGELEFELRHGAHPLPSGPALEEATARFRLDRGRHQVVVGFPMRGAKEMHFAGEAFRALRRLQLRHEAFAGVLEALEQVSPDDPERDALEAVARMNLASTSAQLDSLDAGHAEFERAAAIVERLGHPTLRVLLQMTEATLLTRTPSATAEQIERAYAELIDAHVERGDSFNAARTHLDLIDALVPRGALAAAERWLERARPLVDGFDDPKTDVDLLLAEISLVRAAGDFVTAGRLAEQAVARAVLDSQRAEALVYRGDHEVARGLYGDALATFDELLALAEAMPSPVLRRTALQRTAGIALELDDDVAAMTLLRAALERGPQGRHAPDAVEGSLKLAYALVRRGRVDDAEELLALATASDAGGGHPALRLLATELRADIAHARGDERAQAAHVAQALELARELALPWHVVDLLSHEARLARRGGDPERARSLASESVELAGTTGQHASLADALVELGRAALACGDVPGAARSFGRAQDLLLEQWGGVLSDRWDERLRAAERSERLARLGQDLAAAEIAATTPGSAAWRAAVAEGLRRADRWKGRDLLSQRLAAYGETLLVDDLSGAVERRFDALDLDLLHFAEGNEQLFAYAYLDGAWRHVTLGRLDEIGDEVVAHLEHIAEPASLGGVAEVAASGARLHERLLAPLELGAGARDLVVIDSGVLAGLPLESLVTSAPADAARFTDLRYVLDDRRLSYAPSASALVAPGGERVRARSSELVVLADPAFASEGPPATARGSGVASRVFAPLPGTRAEALAIARAYLSKLHSSSEVDELLSDFDSGARRLDAGGLHLRLGEEATREALLELVEGAAIVHLATHGVQDAREPRRSALALSPSAGGASELYLGEILDWELEAELAVLSACETASGSVRHGEGMRSLAWSFLRAGAEAVVATLWQVDDRESEALMSGFYADYLVERDAPVALHEARLALRHASGEKGTFLGVGRGKRLGPRPVPAPDAALAGHPFFWASFVHVRARLDGGARAGAR